jgi:hypothetical protein
MKNRSLSPTVLARDFNLRWRGAPVTVNAVRKWLVGDAIPTMDKLTVLASLLDTSEDWLRWGDNSVQKSLNNSLVLAATHSSPLPKEQEKSLLQDYRLLSPVHKKLLEAMMEVLLKEQKNSKNSHNLCYSLSRDSAFVSIHLPWFSGDQIRFDKPERFGICGQKVPGKLVF